ncbi:LysR family transcriptional regulator [Variovorax rhizosphaerae]|uniref:LysR family transcriptional regulator n=1 Tax=Variovorax rhizosphaerae TaxID=1836200 RepID=A0ABU8WUN4_9BURK
MNSQRIDLNLLRTFDVLMRTQSATLTARMLHKTQPGVSRDLAKLRHLLADPLLIIVRGRLEPTPRALDLHPAIQESLQRFDACIRSSLPFDPASALQTLNIAAYGYLELQLTPHLQSIVLEQAPGMVVCWHAAQGELVPDDLDAGRVDLQLGVYPECPQRFDMERLTTDRRVLVVRGEHPVVRDTVDLPTFLSLDFLTYSKLLRKETELDHALAQLGHRRRFSLLLSGFANAPFVLAGTDYATTMPLGAARMFAKNFPLRIVELPITLPGMTFSMLWHRRHQTAPAHMWLREQVRRAMRRSSGEVSGGAG